MEEEPYPEKDEVGPWAKQKLQALRDYLNAYTTVLRQQTPIQGYYYVDAFAGRGRVKIRKTDEFIDRSPRVALSTKYPFTAHYFIDLDPKRAKRLERLREDFPGRTLQVFQEDANVVLQQQIAPAIRYKYFRRAVAFLDPYAMQLDFASVKALAKTKAIEIFVNVPTMAMNRKGLRNDPYRIPEDDAAHLTRFWGTEDWREEIYEPGDDDLFGNPQGYKPRPTTARHLSELYRNRLRGLFPCVSEEIAVIQNSTGQPIYGLVWAGWNDTGKKIASRVLTKLGTSLAAPATGATPLPPGVSPLF